jgi:hypothetical protein
MDRNGRFPGDFGTVGLTVTNKNGIIGDDNTALTGEQLATTSAIAEIAATVTQAPANPVVIGGNSWWFYIGNTPATVGVRNCMVICKSVDCITPLTGDDVEMLKAVDTSIDGTADAGVGQVRAITTVPAAGTVLTGLAAATGRANGVAIAPVTAVVTVGGTSLAWAAGQFGAIWVFDKPY